MGLLRHLRAHPDGTWRAHTTYNLDGARTGRLSSSDPNLQNIPRAENPLGKLIKDLFLAPPGRSWVQLDYSQLELRVAALETGDPVMIAIFAAGGDYHLRTAELIAPTFGLSPEQWVALSKEERKSYRSYAKTVNFGVLYGMGVKTLAARMHCDIPTAQRILDAILGKMAKLKAWIAAKKRETQVSGLIWTRWQGRAAQHRPVHRVDYTDTMAVNTPVQGGASYFCTASVNSIERGLEADGLDTVAEMVGTVHDSILLLVEDDYVQEVASVSAAIMEGWTGADSPVRLTVDAEYGKRWGSLTHLDLVR
jgi:DNA polymerase-1